MEKCNKKRINISKISRLLKNDYFPKYSTNLNEKSSSTARS
jgi:hypothetical protein